jgi:hypothetical protein
VKLVVEVGAMSMAAVAGAGAGEYFEVEFVGGDGRRRRGPLVEALSEGFEDALAVRGFRWSRSQEHFPGWWWSSTTGRHVGYESWLERDHAMLLDFDPAVVGFSSQPFCLCWHDGIRSRRHSPDYFARRADGGGLVVDVRADERVEAKDRAVFATTERACAQVGWRFVRVGVLESVFAANVRWLSRYRHPRCLREVCAQRLLEIFARPTALRVGAALAGDPLTTLPVLYHLLWRRDLICDLRGALLGSDTLVLLGAARSGSAR